MLYWPCRSGSDKEHRNTHTCIPDTVYQKYSKSLEKGQVTQQMVMRLIETEKKINLDPYLISYCKNTIKDQ